MVPEIAILNPGKAQKAWNLTTPVGFIDRPEKGFNLSDRFDRRKAYSYYSSFTRIASIYAIGAHGLAVCWQLGDHPFLLDVFDYRSGKRYFRTMRIPGKLTGVLGNKIYIYEDNNHFETGQAFEDEAVALHIWDLDARLLGDGTSP